MLTAYLDSRFSDAPDQEKQAFRKLLEMPDPDLFSLLVGRTTVSNEAISDLVNRLKTQVRQR